MVIVTKNIFSSRITKQRKDKGVSQKQAAMDLGVSQALLSHYENGVRECGLDFVVRAADYYSVSCDYLLGYSNSAVLLEGAPDIMDISEDKEISTSTVGRATLAIGGHLSQDDEMKNYIIKLYGIATYMMLAGAVKKGLLPESWIGSNSVNRNQYSFLAYTLASALDDLKDSNPSNMQEEAPDCVKTVLDWVYDYLNLNIASLL